MASRTAASVQPETAEDGILREVLIRFLDGSFRRIQTLHKDSQRYAEHLFQAAAQRPRPE